MKTDARSDPLPAVQITEDDIRDYAFHLYQQRGCIPDRDLDNWLEAKACLEANVLRRPSRPRRRLHRHRHPEAEEDTFTVLAVETEPEPAFERM